MRETLSGWAENTNLYEKCDAFMIHDTYISVTWNDEEEKKRKRTNDKESECQETEVIQKK